jgi:hypothetical protein
MELEGLLEKLKMETLAAQADALLEQAAKRDLGYRKFLTEALQTVWSGRNLKTTEGRMPLDDENREIPLLTIGNSIC